MTEKLYNNNLSARHPTTILRHTLQHIFHFNQPSPTYAQDSLRNSHTQNEIPPSVQSKRKSYVLVLISCIPNSLAISLSCLTSPVQTISLISQAGIRTCTLTNIFTFLFQKSLHKYPSQHSLPFGYIGLLS